MPIGAGLGAASIIGGGISAYGANRASQRQAEAQRQAAEANARATQESLQAQRDMFGQSQQQYEIGRQTLQPFVDTGRGAMYSLAQLYGLPGSGASEAFNDNALEAFRRSPDYDWRMKEGLRALTFSDSARGTLGSTGHLDRTVAFGQGLASQGLGDYTGRLLALSQIGAGAAGTSAGLGAQAGGMYTQQGIALGNTITGGGQQQANSLLGQGQAEAAGIVGMTNSITGGINNAANGLLMYNALNNRGRSSYSNNSLSPVTYDPSRSAYAIY